MRLKNLIGEGMWRERGMIYGAMNFPVAPVLEEIERIAAQGFDYVELTMDPPQAHYEILREHQGEISRVLEHNCMDLVFHLPTFLHTADLNPRLREISTSEMLASLETAAGFRPLKVVLHPSYAMGLGTFVMDRVRELAMDCLSRMVESAERLGVVLCLENMFPVSPLLVEPEEFSEVLHRFPTLQMTLDTGHANIADSKGTRALQFIETFGSRVGHIHASDNFGKEDNHLPVGTGTVKFKEIAGALKDVGYDGTVTLEVFSQDSDYARISREKLRVLFETE